MGQGLILEPNQCTPSMRGHTQLKKALLGAKHVTPDCEIDHIPHAQCPYTLSDYATDSLPVHSLSQTIPTQQEGLLYDEGHLLQAVNCSDCSHLRDAHWVCNCT